MVHHLTDACSGHCWPLAENIKYDTCYRFTMPESLEDHRRLLVSEEDSSVFLLIVGTGEARPGRRPVFVACVRGIAADAETDARQVYGCKVNVTTPPSHVGGETGLIRQTWNLRSWDYPAKYGLGKPMASVLSFTRRLGARGLQGGSPGHTHYQVHLENM